MCFSISGVEKLQLLQKNMLSRNEVQAVQVFRIPEDSDSAGNAVSSSPDQSSGSSIVKHTNDS